MRNEIIFLSSSPPERPEGFSKMIPEVIE
jgi:hypothetical protein